MRRNQLWARLGTVTDVETAKDLITYTEDREPLSIYGRWGSRIRHHGDAENTSRRFGRRQGLHNRTDQETLASLSRKPSITGDKRSFWMKYGTAHVQQTPFIWSASQFADMKMPEEQDCVPDALDGRWNRVKMFME